MSSPKAGSLALQKKGFNVLLGFVTSLSSEISLSPNPIWGRNEFSVLPLLDSSDFCSFVNIPKSTWRGSSCPSAAYLKVPLKGRAKPSTLLQVVEENAARFRPQAGIREKNWPDRGVGPYPAPARCVECLPGRSPLSEVQPEQTVLPTVLRGDLNRHPHRCGRMHCHQKLALGNFPALTVSLRLGIHYYKSLKI